MSVFYFSLDFSTYLHLLVLLFFLFLTFNSPFSFFLLPLFHFLCALKRPT